MKTGSFSLFSTVVFSREKNSKIKNYFSRIRRILQILQKNFVLRKFQMKIVIRKKFLSRIIEIITITSNNDKFIVYNCDLQVVETTEQRVAPITHCEIVATIILLG